MKRIYLFLEQEEVRDYFRKELTALGYHVQTEFEQYQTCNSLSIVDAIHLERNPSRFVQPIFYSDCITAETSSWVVEYPCSGVVDSSVKGIHLKSMIEICLALKRERDQLIKENQKLQKKLQDRRIIEKAKFLLMKRSRTSEEEAYQWMRSEAMAKQKTLREIADLILLNEE